MKITDQSGRLSWSDNLSFKFKKIKKPCGRRLVLVLRPQGVRMVVKLKGINGKMKAIVPAYIDMAFAVVSVVGKKL